MTAVPMNVMSEDRKHNIKVVVANETIQLYNVSESEEIGFRKAAFSANETWKKMCAAQPGKSSHFILAKVAMAYAGLMFSKQDQLEAQAKFLDDFEHRLDEWLLKMES